MITYAKEYSLPVNHLVNNHQTWVTQPLPSPVSANLTIDWRDIVSFYRNPARFFCQRVMDLNLPKKIDPLLSEEPFFEATDFEASRSLFSHLQHGRQENLDQAIRFGYHAPPGRLGEMFAQQQLAQYQSVWGKIESVLQQSTPVPEIEFEIPFDQYTITGKINSLYDTGWIGYDYYKLSASKQIEAYLHAILLATLNPKQSSTRATFLTQDKPIAFNIPPQKSNHLLQTMLTCYLKGLQAPLPFFPKSSIDYVQSVRKAKPFKADAWKGSPFTQGEGDDRWFLQAFSRRNSPEDIDGFQETALALLSAFLDYQTE